MGNVRREILVGGTAAFMVVLGVAPLLGCAGTTIAVKERLGYAKREQLVDQVQDARDEQEEAREQFATTLDEFKSLTGYDGGDLEKTYNRLKKELSRSEDAAGDVKGRIRGIERVAEALFSEWEASSISSSPPRCAARARTSSTRRVTGTVS